MSEIFHAIDHHTHLCESLHKHSRSSFMERTSIVQSNMLFKFAYDRGINLSKTLATFTDALEPSWADNPNTASLFEDFQRYIMTPEGEKEFEARLLGFVKEEQTLMDNAETIYVTKQIIDEITEATETMPDNVLIDHDMFVPNGLLVFEEPINYTLTVQNGLFVEQWKIYALQFNTTNMTKNTNGVEIRMYGSWCETYARKVDQKIVYNPKSRGFELENVDNPEEFMTEVLGIDGSGLWVGELNRRAQHKTNLADSTFYEFNKDEPLIESLGQLKKFMIALFRMTHSYIDIERQKPPRHFTKRAKRSTRVIPDEFYLSVLTLRHRISEHQGGTHSSPKFAFRVRGHWAKRYLRSLGKPVGDPDAYRYVYIKDYIKGKDKQLVESTRVIRIAN